MFLLVDVFKAFIVKVLQMLSLRNKLCLKPLRGGSSHFSLWSLVYCYFTAAISHHKHTACSRIFNEHPTQFLFSVDFECKRAPSPLMIPPSCACYRCIQENNRPSDHLNFFFLLWLLRKNSPGLLLFFLSYVITAPPTGVPADLIANINRGNHRRIDSP